MCLGHADPGFTLPTSTHLMEGSPGRTKREIDTALGTHSADDGDVAADHDGFDLEDTATPVDVTVVDEELDEDEEDPE